MSVLTIAGALDAARAELQFFGDDAGREADVLLAHVLQKNTAYLRTWPEQVLELAQQERYLKLVSLRAQGEPFAYLTGEQEFFSLPFFVSHDTLIPRADTELLVQSVLDTFPAEPAIDLVDLGTGTGAIACALAHARPRWRIWASDASVGALRIAEKNARRLQTQLQFCCGSWLTPFAGKKFDCIVSNPPYIAEGDSHLQDLQHEPMSALVSTGEGLDDVRHLISTAPLHLRHAGQLWLEHGYDQGEAVRALMQEQGFRDVRTLRDLGGQERLTTGVWP